MALFTRHPLQSLCVLKISIIALVFCSCVATCYSEDGTLTLSHKTKNGNITSKGDVHMSNPSSGRSPSEKKEDNGCHSACHQTTKQEEQEDNEKATINNPDLVERVNGSVRQTRSLPENTQKSGHQRPGRAGALNKNFLRFGRGNLNKNFLRFGRGGNLKQNFLRFGRGGLQKNFLRFGRKDGEEYELSSGEKSDVGVLENHPNNEENSDMRSAIGTSDNLLQAIERLRSEMNENQEETLEKQGNDQSFVDMEADDGTARGPGAFEMEENGSKVKRGSLSNNFLRYSRNYNKLNMFGGKRGSLNRNFLRFGKRSGPPNVDAEKDAIQEEEDETGRKVKRELGLDMEAEESEQPDKKSVLFLASPWLSKNVSNQTKEQRSVHGDSIRRRSLDAKLTNRLHNNFIRFGRR